MVGRLGEEREDMTDSYLMSLWSKAVRVEKGDKCYNPECPNEAHSVHHIIRRGHRLTRFDVKNGLPLCAECHRRAQRSIGWDIDLVPEDKLYLQERANINIKDWLVRLGMTMKECEKQEAERLKRIIAEGER